MARKKSDGETIEEAVVDPVELTLRQLESVYGQGVIKTSEEMIRHRPLVIPTTPNLDVALGGGIPEGSWVSLSGPEKCGKTMLALSFCAEAQKPEYGNRPVFYLGVEHRLKERDLTGVRGLDLSSSRFRVFESVRGNILDAKKFLDIAGQLLRDVPGCVVVFDCISALCNAQVMENGVGTADYGSGNKLVAQFCDIHASTVRINRSIVVGIVQTYVNAGNTYGPPRSEKAASRWKYQGDVVLQCKKTVPWRIGKDENSRQIGQEVHWLVKSTALHANPGVTAVNYLRYGVGMDKVYEAMKLAESLGLIEPSGSWATLSYLSKNPSLLEGTDFAAKGEVKVQGAEKVYTLLARYPAWYTLLTQSIQEKLSA